jgi:hypothetical protein
MLEDGSETRRLILFEMSYGFVLGLCNNGPNHTLNKAILIL